MPVSAPSLLSARCSIRSLVSAVKTNPTATLVGGAGAIEGEKCGNGLHSLPFLQHVCTCNSVTITFCTCKNMILRRISAASDFGAMQIVVSSVFVCNLNATKRCCLLQCKRHAARRNFLPPAGSAALVCSTPLNNGCMIEALVGSASA